MTLNLPPLLQSYDRIVVDLNKEDDKLKQYVAEQTKGKIVPLNVPLEKGILLLIDMFSNIPYTPYLFQLDDESGHIICRLVNPTGDKTQCRFRINTTNGEVHMLTTEAVDNEQSFEKKMKMLHLLKESSSHAAETLLCFFLVMTMCKDDNSILDITEKRIRSIGSRKKTSGKKKSKGITRVLRQTTYQFADDGLGKFKNRRQSYERQTFQWTRRGHWRTLKNGKRIWIKPTTIVLDEKPSIADGKTYQL